MKTLVIEDMPRLFWDEIKKRNYQNYFYNSIPYGDVKVIILRTKTIASPQFIDKFPDLKMIIRAGTGLDNVDYHYAKSKGIIVQNTPNANAISAYEHTMAMIFALIKKIPTAKNNILQNKWKNNFVFNYEFSDITPLVVGLGRIGTKVAKALKFFGFSVMGVDPYLDKKKWEELDIKQVSYYEGLKKCNLITFHCPLTPKTRDYFSLKTLDLLKNPVYLINVARGEITNEKAIEVGLQKNKLLGVALDVFKREPWPVKSFALQDNVLLSPHIGAYTQKAKNRLALETLDVWEDFVFNNKIKNPYIEYP